MRIVTDFDGDLNFVCLILIQVLFPHFTTLTYSGNHVESLM